MASSASPCCQKTPPPVSISRCTLLGWWCLLACLVSLPLLCSRLHRMGGETIPQASRFSPRCVLKVVVVEVRAPIFHAALFVIFLWYRNLIYKSLFNSIGGSEGAAVFKVTRQKLAIVLKNALKENFLVYLHLLCSVF